MRNFLEALLESANNSNIDDVTIDENIEKEIAECTLPANVLIECIMTDATTSINAALETYEMACIVGGVKVVSEGLEAEGASALLENAAKDFFKKIVEQLKKIKDWFVGTIKKIASKFSSLGGDINKKYEKYRADFDKNFESDKYKFTGKIIDWKTGEDTFEALTDSIEKTFDNIIELGSDDRNMTADMISDDAQKGIKNIDTWGMLSDAVGSKVENSAGVIELIKKKYGVSDDIESKDIKVSSSDADTMKKVVESVSKDNKKIANASIDIVNSKCNTAIKVVNDAESNAKENADAVKIIREMATSMNTLAGLYAQIVNTRLSVFGGAAKAYIAFIVKVAKKEAVSESMDFSHLFEGADIDDVADDDDDVVEEAWEFTNLKVVREMMSEKKKDANDLVKKGNKLFKRGEYKEAKENYKKSLPIWKELAKVIGNIPEKEPGWFKSNDWALLIPYLNLPLLLCLVYQQSSVVRYVPKYKFDMEDIRKKTDKITRTGSIAKADILLAITTVIDYVEFQIKACDSPDGIALENTSNNADILSEMLESVAEAIEGDDYDDTSVATENQDLVDLAYSFLSS